MGLNILVFIPKGNTDTRGIGLLEMLRMVVESIINACLRSSIQCYDVLHGFHTGRGTGKMNMEIKIAQ